MSIPRVRHGLAIAALVVALLPACGPGASEELAPAVLEVAPSLLEFAAPQDTTYLEVANTGGSPLTFQVSVVAQSGGVDWLTVVPDSGSISGGGARSLIVSVVNRDSLAPGTYTGQVTLSSAEADSEGVLVSMTVGQPLLEVDPAEVLDFGDSDTTRTLLISNVGEGLLDYKVHLPQGWVSSEADLQKQIPPGEPESAVLEIDRLNVPWYGAGSAELLITSNGLADADHSNVAKLVLKVYVEDSCEVNADCLKEGFYCVDGETTGVCTARKGDGATCEGPGQCKSGFCVDEVCCDQSCTSQCSTCILTGQQGTCLPHPDGDDCDDGTACTLGDACVEGECLPGDPVDCSSLESQCSKGQCDETTGECAAVVDEGYCAVLGKCIPAGQMHTDIGCLQCVPGKSATEWSVVSGACYFLGECLASGDAVGDGCLVCAPALPSTPMPAVDGADCPGDDNDCSADVCEGGICRHIAIDEGPCEDGNLCTSGDECEDGICKGTFYVCDDGIDCTQDSCTGDGGCGVEVEEGYCLIANKCVPAETVAAGNGGCQLCKPGNAQTAWSDQPNGLACDDGKLCTGPDLCESGVCMGDPVACNDGYDCTQDSCEAATGECVNLLTAGWCVIDGVCVADGAGSPGKDSECSSCVANENPLAWTPVNEGQDCDDLSECSAGSMCLSGQCVVTVFPLCDDGNSCTQDSCVDEATCQHEVQGDGTPCAPDPYGCTTDQCDDGACEHPVQDGSCLIGELCLEDGAKQVGNDCLYCDPGAAQGQWTGAPDGVSCGDGLVCYQEACCPVADNCAGKECGDDGCGGTCGECDDSLDCTVDSCSDGGCSFAVAGDFCVVDGVCVNNGEADDDNPCRECDVAKTQGDWTPRADGLECGLGSVCSLGECCVVQCSGKVCGDDGCGGSCGDCSCGEECVAGQCDFVACQGRECGDDSCGGQCGPECDDGIGCTADICVEGLCQAVVPKGFCAVEGVCAPQDSEQSGNPCRVCDAAQNELDWTVLEDGVPCGLGKVCAQGVCCDLLANCDGRECGDNGCGGTCGDCDDDLDCTNDACEDYKCVHEVQPFFCAIGEECVTAGAENPDNVCVECRPEDDAWTWLAVEDGLDCEIAGAVCLLGECCLPDCDEAECGSDTCGGSCGECGLGQLCIYGQCPAPGEECDDGNELAWDGCDEGKVTEFLVDPECQGYKKSLESATTVLANGNYLVIHQTVTDPVGKPEDVDGIQGELFDPQGQLVVPPFAVNTHEGAGKGDPDVAPLPGGGFVAVWTSSGQDGSSDAVYAQLFKTGGAKSGWEFLVNTTTDGYQYDPTVATWSDGSFIVCWQSDNVDISSMGIVCQRFTGKAVKEGGEVLVNSNGEGLQRQASVATIAQGKAIVVWATATHPQDAAHAVIGQLLDAEGNKQGGEFLVNSYTGYEQWSPNVAARSCGGFVVVWQGRGNGGMGYDQDGIFARLFGEDGAPLAGEFRVNVHLNGKQDRPAVAAGPDCSFAVSWDGPSLDGSHTAVWFQQFDADAMPVGDQVTVSTFPWWEKVLSDISLFPDGKALVSWSAVISWPDSARYCTFARRFEADGGNVYR